MAGVAAGGSGTRCRRARHRATARYTLQNRRKIFYSQKSQLKHLAPWLHDVLLGEDGARKELVADAVTEGCVHGGPTAGRRGPHQVLFLRLPILIPKFSTKDSFYRPVDKLLGAGAEHPHQHRVGLVGVPGPHQLVCQAVREHSELDTVSRPVRSAGSRISHRRSELSYIIEFLLILCCFSLFCMQWRRAMLRG